MTCDWCGHAHAQTQLCTLRPKWSRRGFLMTVAKGIVGAVALTTIPTPVTLTWNGVNTYITEAEADAYVLGVLRRTGMTLPVNFRKPK